MYIQETLQTPCKGSWDVIVCGGGVSGVAAAVQAARSGAKVLLLEKSVSLGGLATIGLIAWYEPLCNGQGLRMMNGMSLELFELAIAHGPHTLPESWRGFPPSVQDDSRCSAFFSPTIFTMALDQWVLDAGVTLAFDTLVARPVAENGRILGVVTEDKDGRCYHEAKVVIDATGDGDLFARCGLPYEEGRNFLTFIGYETDAEACRRALDSGNMIHARRWHNAGANLWGGGHPEDEPYYHGISADNVNQLLIKGRARLMAQIKDSPAMGRDITVLPSMPQFRMTRRLKGAFELREDHMGQRFDDSIGVATDFFHRGHVYELPMGMLYAPQLDNLLTAGRTVSSTGWAWEMTRVIPVAIATGQAAGLMAARMAQTGAGASQLDACDVQARLEKNGVRLHI